MKLGNNPISRKNNIVIQAVENETLIYDLAKDKVYCLNETSAMIWQECDGKKSVREISQSLSNKLKTNFSEDLVWLALNQFRTGQLIEKNVDLITPFDGLSRREIVKRIGFASMIALPVISTILAPTAVNAQSVACGCTGSASMRAFSPGCSCGSNADCCSNVCGGGGTICAVSSGNPAGAAACCPVVICPPANQVGLAPGCGCVGNANCSSGSCLTNICSV